MALLSRLSIGKSSETCLKYAFAGVFSCNLRNRGLSDPQIFDQKNIQWPLMPHGSDSSAFEQNAFAFEFFRSDSSRSVFGVLQIPLHRGHSYGFHMPEDLEESANDVSEVWADSVKKKRKKKMNKHKYKKLRKRMRRKKRK